MRVPDLQITKFELGVVETNLTELEKVVDGALEKYRGIVFTEDQINEAKDTRKNLNNLSKAVNKWRIDKEREFNEPFAAIKTQARRICDNIDQVNGEIDKQIKTFEEAQKEEKRAAISAWWTENGKRTVPLEKVWDERYLNKTCSEKQWQADLTTKRERITAELMQITQMGDPEKVDFLITNYMQTLDVSAALEAWNRQEEAKRLAEEEKARMEAERLAREERARQQEKMRQNGVETVQNVPISGQEGQKTEQKDDVRDYLYSPEFRLIDVTYDQMVALAKFFKENGIEYETLKQGKDARRRK